MMNLVSWVGGLKPAAFIPRTHDTLAWGIHPPNMLATGMWAGSFNSSLFIANWFQQPTLVLTCVTIGVKCHLLKIELVLWLSLLSPSLETIWEGFDPSSRQFCSQWRWNWCHGRIVLQTLLKLKSGSPSIRFWKFDISYIPMKVLYLKGRSFVH